MTTPVEQIVSHILLSEGESVVRDMAGHVGDEVHELLKRHGMTMRTAGGAAAMAVLAGIQVLTEAVEFARRSMDGDADDEKSITDAMVTLFIAELPADLRAAIEHHLREQSRPMDREALIAAAQSAATQFGGSLNPLRIDAIVDAIIALLATPPASEDRGGYVLVPRADLVRVRRSMRLLQQNSEGCVANHYGNTAYLQGGPGWLADTRRDVEALTAMLTASEKEQARG